MSILRSRNDKSSDAQINPIGWMITFSDLVTLLLTFFVMIICITSQEPRSMGQVDGQFEGNAAGNGVFLFSNRSLLMPAIIYAEKLGSIPPEAMLDPEEVKAAVFQLDPNRDPDYQRLEQAVTEAVDISQDERGLVISWDQKLMFMEGKSQLIGDYDLLLKRLAAFLASVSLFVSIDSYTNPFSDLEGGNGPGGYILSKERSKTLLEYFVKLGVNPKRFRLGAYGSSKPLVTDDPSRFSENSRVEIILYKPKDSSWNG